MNWFRMQKQAMMVAIILTSGCLEVSDLKVIFLDIDGVLNCQSSKSSCNAMLGIDDDKVRRLKKIIENTNAKIVLISSWKNDWQNIYKEQQGYMANYLDKKLKRQGLAIMDKTEGDSVNRGRGIIDWLDGKKIESFVILDDEDFDYQEVGISDRVVKTSFYDDNGGLQDNEMKQAIVCLNRKETEIYENNRFY